jgi:two-component system heavy metal sensor histidine kinase CusS
MSWRFDKSKEGKSDTPRSHSIATRLMVLYTLTSTALLLVAMGTIYLALVQHIDDEDISFLSDHMREIRVELRGGSRGVAEIVKEFAPPSDLQPSGHFIRILNQRGEILAEMSGMEEQLPVEVFPEASREDEPQSKIIEYRNRLGRWYFVTAGLGAAANAVDGPLIIQIAQDRSDDHRFMNRFRILLGGLLVGGVLAAALLGGVVARRGLRPVRQMAEVVHGIDATQLQTGIAASGWPKELTALGDAFDKMLHRLEEAFARLSQFSADLAHELRTPIGILRGETEVALSRRRSAEEYQEVLISSAEELDRLTSMIDGLLFLARAGNPETRIGRKAVDGRTECEAIVAFHEAVAQEKGIVLAVEGEAELNVDPMLLRRAVSNLVTNALEYTPGGGRVTIGLFTDALGARVRVSDTGCGIATEQLPRLFDRFYRVDPARHGGGAGLGLAIVKSIVQLHGGSVHVTSTLGSGTAFTLTFPKEETERPLAAPR